MSQIDKAVAVEEGSRAQKLTSVRSIERALNILDCFTREKPSLTLADISKQVGLYPSTTLRLLTTLENRNYLKRDEKTLEYSLGYRLVNLGALCLASENLRDIARPFLIKLRDKYNESVGLYIRHNDVRVCIDSVASTQPLHRAIDIGRQMSLTRGASGKLLLAYLPENDIDRILQKDPYVTREQLKEIREAGFAVSFSEREQNLVSIATPIFDSEQRIQAALFISGPSNRITPQRLPEIVDYMKELASSVSMLLGY